MMDPHHEPPSSSGPRGLSQHPVAKALDAFASTTPFVTRGLVYLQWITYLLSWLLPDPTLALALSNYPEFSLRHLELYRLLTSVLVNTRLSDLVFVYWLVVPASATVERAFGSAKFAAFVASLALATNLLFSAMWMVGSALTNSSASWTSQHTSSVWIVGYGVMSLEAMMSLSMADSHNGDSDNQKYRKVCLWTVRAQYAPALLYVLTGVLSLRYDLGCLVSLLLGYLLGAHQMQQQTGGGFGGLRRIGAALDRIVVNPLSLSQLQRCEETGLLARAVAFSRSSTRSAGGWVTVPSATGMQAWNYPAPGRGESAAAAAESMLPLFQMPARRAASSAAQGGGGGLEGGGRVLGGGGAAGGSSLSARPRTMAAAPPPSRDDDVARLARLQALDRRDPAGSNSNNKGVGGGGGGGNDNSSSSSAASGAA